VEETAEEGHVHRYFEAFNSHDIDRVMACLHEQPVVCGSDRKALRGLRGVRRFYADQFSDIPMVGANYARSPATAPVAWPSRCFTVYVPATPR